MNYCVGDFDKSRNNNFDFLRFVAASLVIISHSYSLNGQRFNEPLVWLSNDLISFGSIAVNAFFIISGYLITKSFWMKHDPLVFIESRFLRIFPGLWLNLLLSISLLLFQSTTDFKSYLTSIQTIKFLTYNFVLLKVQYSLPGVFQDNPYPNVVNGSLWTLPNELIMYLSVLVLGVLFYKKKYGTQIVSLLFLAVVFIYFFTFKSKPEAASLFRLAAYFCLGGLVYFFRKRIPLNFNLLIFLSFLLSISIYTDFFYLFLAVFEAYIIFMIAFSKNIKLNNFGAHGDYSYGLYIYSFTIQQVLIAHFPNLNLLYHFLIAFLISLLLAKMSWDIVESKAIKNKGIFVNYITRSKKNEY